MLAVVTVYQSFGFVEDQTFVNCERHSNIPFQDTIEIKNVSAIVHAKITMIAVKIT